MERFVATLLRSSVVRESLRFAARELAGRRRLAGYRLRTSGRLVYVRHGTPDVVTLDEVFYSRDYEPPLPVEAILESLRRPPEVLDLGANIGLFGVFVLERFPRARITAFEPDAANTEVLHRCVAANDHSGAWRVVEAAAANHDGTVAFSSGRFALSRVELPEALVDAGHVRAVDVFPYLSRADLLKMDIEGGEWAILGDRRFGRGAPAALVLEYHPHLCPEPDPRRAATRIVASAGYELEVGDQLADGSGILWAWRRR